MITLAGAVALSATVLLFTFLAIVLYTKQGSFRDRWQRNYWRDTAKYIGFIAAAFYLIAIWVWFFAGI